MAFRQPTISPKHLHVRGTQEHAQKSYTSNLAISDSQEWVIFSPPLVQASPSLSASHTISRLSDFGSFNATTTNEKEVSNVVDDGDELDSLDDGLHAFREPTIHHNSRRPDHGEGAIFPAHDGLGLFAPSSSLVQERLRSFEKDNQISSLPQPRVLIEGESKSTWLDDARMERIEKWRLEQARLDKACNSSAGQVSERSIDQDCSFFVSRNRSKEDDETARYNEDSCPEKETVWRRLARRVIRDLIGLDDSILCIIFGESLPLDADPLVPKQSLHSKRLPDNSTRLPPEGWEERILQGLARKLGLLIYQLSLQPSTYVEDTPSTMDYAGMPIGGRRGIEKDMVGVDGASQATEFESALLEREGAPSPSEWGIEDSKGHLPPYSAAEIEYWEQTPDLKTIFSYLGRRFVAKQGSYTDTVEPTTTRTSQSLRRAAIIRQQHPLTTTRCRRAQQHTSPSSTQRRMQHTSAGLSLVASSLKRTGESCTSPSTKRSKQHSSRNYWDLGSSLGSGSVAFRGAGTWGEV